MIESRKEIQEHLHNIQELAIREHLRKCEEIIQEMKLDIGCLATLLELTDIPEIKKIAREVIGKYESRGL